MTPRAAATTGAAAWSRRRLLQQEGIALEGFSGTVAALLLVAHWRPLPGLTVGALVAILLVAVAQGVLRRRAGDSSDEPLTLNCVTKKRFDKAALRPKPEHEGETHLVGLLLVGAFLPFIAAFLLLELTLLYVVPIGAVLLVAALVHESDVLTLMTAVAIPIGLSILNEFAVTRPLAKRWHLPSDGPAC